jgi:integrase
MIPTPSAPMLSHANFRRSAGGVAPLCAVRRPRRVRAGSVRCRLFRPRNSRHTHATLLGEVGESLRTVQAILGHSDLKTTLNLYTHAIPESQKLAIGRVADLLFPSVPEFSVVT